MSVVIGGVVPHPPIAVPEVGRREADKVKNTQNAILTLAEQIKKSGAQVLVVISPHSPVFADAIALNMSNKLTGNLARFGVWNVAFSFDNQRKLGQEIIKQCSELNLMAVALDEQLAGEFNISIALDHGVTVPLYFLRQGGVNLPLVVVSIAQFSFEELYRFGIAVDRAANALGLPTALLASGDLSHRLTPDAPAGYHPQGTAFDQQITQMVSKVDVLGLVDIDYEMAEQAGECGLRSIIMMMGAFDGKEAAAEVLSYEGPFGVGYMVASIKPGKPNDNRGLLQRLQEQKYNKVTARRLNESFIVRIARETLESYVLGKPKPVINNEQIPPEFKKQAATFVTIKKNGQLRGCIGSIFPRYSNVVEEVMRNAVSAGTHDPRFYPVEPEELHELVYSVDVLTEPEPVTSLEELDPQQYGVIVRNGNRSGLLLPDLEGVDTAAKQVDIARQKAGIEPGEKVKLERFMVKRYK